MRESTCVEVSSHVQRTSLCQYFPCRPDSLGPDELGAKGGSMAGFIVASRSSGRLPHTQPNVNAVQVKKRQQMVAQRLTNTNRTETSIAP